MVELHNTLMGRKLIEHDIPEIARQLKRIADKLDKEEELKSVAKKVWVDIYNNDTLTYNSFEEYWNNNKH